MTDVLISEDNLLRYRCSKSLCRKLKKYKLRRDENEEPEILNVSQIFYDALKIQSSPTKLTLTTADHNLNDVEIVRPLNYLTKMVKRKQSSKNTHSNTIKGENKDKNDKSKDKHNGDNVMVEKQLVNKPSSIFRVHEGKMKDKTEKPESKNNKTKNLVQHTNDKKSTNAFTLMMESRNKSMGTNSPGKERPEEILTIDIKQKKEVKVKRNLALQKLAEAKGSLKKKEIDECEEIYINKQMEKRAKRLKNMIKQKSKLTKTIGHNLELNLTASKTKKRNIIVSEKISAPCKIKATSILKEVDIFDIPEKVLQPIAVSPSHKTKIMSKEDEEFLKKLSPSMKKKENMLSYFQRVEKDSSIIICDSDSNSLPHETEVIKVKLSKPKKGKLKLLSLKKHKKENEIRNTESDISSTTNGTMLVNCDVSSNIDITPTESNLKTISREKILPRKRKRINNVEKSNSDINNSKNKTNTDEILASTTDERPRRSARKPVRYFDEANLSSSDDELLITMSKKKKITMHDLKDNDENDKKVKRGKEMVDISSKKNKPSSSAKLAPIFKAKVHIDPAALEAKQKFLHSGVPDQLKKIISQQQNQQILSNNFCSVVHVHQNSYVSENYVAPLPLLPIDDIDTEKIKQTKTVNFKTLLSLVESKEIETIVGNDTGNFQKILKKIKESYPAFPVYRIYKTLKIKSNGEQNNSSIAYLDNSSEIVKNMTDNKSEDPESLIWMDKYRATSTKHLIGNFESIKELKNWLVSWSESVIPTKKNLKEDSDSSDFCYSDTDSRDSVRISNNLLILTGSTGSGKTSSVYAVAAELAIKVIEVNASSKRTGKILLQDLHEATQSHKVNRAKGSSRENSQNSQEFKDSQIQSKRKSSKNKLKSKSIVAEMFAKSESQQCSQDEGQTAMSLILIDDADIVFEQDDGFVSAINQLVQCSKRPVIIVTTSLTCQHLQRFLQCSKIIKMNPLSPKMLGTWLDIMCLADTNICWPGAGAAILDHFKGDIRKSINCLQFYMSSQDNDDKKHDETEKLNKNSNNCIDIEENSNMSWSGCDYPEENTKDSFVFSTTNTYNSIMKHLIGLSSNNHIAYPLRLLDVWWSLSVQLKEKATKQKKADKKNELQEMFHIIDSISTADCLSRAGVCSKIEVASNPWFQSDTDSVSERENSDTYNHCFETSNDIAHALVNSYFKSRTKTVEYGSFPGLVIQRDRDKILSRYNTLSDSFVPSSLLDRRAVALDYWSSCRAICRSEKTKTEFNTKRNNRYCHYLKSTKVSCKIDDFDKLCESLK